jgi:hypothetical protein
MAAQLNAVTITPSEEAAAGDVSEAAASGDVSEAAASGDVSEAAPAAPGRFYLHSACHDDIVFAHEKGYWDTRKRYHAVPQVGDTLVLRNTDDCRHQRNGKLFYDVGVITHQAEALTAATSVTWPSSDHTHYTFDATLPYRYRIAFSPAAALVPAANDQVTQVAHWGVRISSGNMRL